MHKSINCRDCHGFVGKDVFPSSKCAICGNHDGSPLVSGGDQLEENAGFCLILVDVGDIVEHDQIILVEFVDSAFESQIAPSALEPLDEIGGSGEENPKAVFNQCSPQSRPQVGFAGAWRT